MPAVGRTRLTNINFIPNPSGKAPVIFIKNKNTSPDTAVPRKYRLPIEKIFSIFIFSKNFTAKYTNKDEIFYL